MNNDIFSPWKSHFIWKLSENYFKGLYSLKLINAQAKIQSLQNCTIMYAVLNFCSVRFMIVLYRLNCCSASGLTLQTFLTWSGSPWSLKTTNNWESYVQAKITPFTHSLHSIQSLYILHIWSGKQFSSVQSCTHL